jgi:hypothetical protein
MFLIPVPVQSYSGYKAEESPRSFVWMNRRVEVETILDRWYEGGLAPGRAKEDYFKVRDRGGKIFLLKHSHEKEEWFICFNVEE